MPTGFGSKVSSRSSMGAPACVVAVRCEAGRSGVGGTLGVQRKTCAAGHGWVAPVDRWLGNPAWQRVLLRGASCVRRGAPRPTVALSPVATVTTCASPDLETDLVEVAVEPPFPLPTEAFAFGGIGSEIGGRLCTAVGLKSGAAVAQCARTAPPLKR